jgi:hypothetical protein
MMVRQDSFKQTSSYEAFESLIFDRPLQGNKTYVFPMGRKYIGEWANRSQNGYGREVFPNLAVVEGFWKDGVCEGGTVVFEDKSKEFT